MSNLFRKFVLARESAQVKSIAEDLNMEFHAYNLDKIKMNGVNAYEMTDENLIYLYPLNDGMPTRNYRFYKNGELVIANYKNYSEITNLDDIILKLVRLYDESIDKGLVLDPYYFMLRLTDKVTKDYDGKADLIITECAIRNQKLNEENFDEANRHFINHFLDHFIGWNFGVSVNRNETLENELIELNNKVIDKGIREYAGPGFEVMGLLDKEYNGLQHYKLPVEKTKTIGSRK